MPAKGANSFTMSEASSRIAKNGFTNVTGLAKDTDGVWRGQADKDGTNVAVWLDYKGNVGTN
jgi:putative membrane protein